MNFEVIKSLGSENIIILDTSAILENPDWDTYKSCINLGESKNLYILTTCVLNEIDIKNHAIKGGFPEARNFITNLRIIKGKLSEGHALDNGDILYFFPENLSTIEDKKIDYADEQSVDFKLIELAIKLKEAGVNVSIAARDSVIQILCKEFEINYIFFSKPQPSSSTSTDSSFQPVLKIGVEN